MSSEGDRIMQTQRDHRKARKQAKAAVRCPHCRRWTDQGHTLLCPNRRIEELEGRHVR